MKKYYPYLVWSLAALYYFYEFFLQVSPSVMVPDLMKSFHVSAEALGILGGVYFCAYAGMQIPAGVLLDRFGPRKILTFASFVCVIGALSFSLTTQLYAALIARFLIGFGSAFAVVSCLKLAANWFPTTRFALLTGLMLTVGMSGAIGGETPLALMVKNMGWRDSLMILATVGAVLCVLIFSIVRDKPKHAKSTQETKETWSNLYKGLRYIIVNKHTWFAAIYGGLMFAPTSVLGGLWGVPYLVAHYQISGATAGSVISMLFVGWAVGSPIGGWISDYLSRRKPTMIVGSIGALISILLFLYANDLSLWTSGFLLFCFGFFSSGFLPVFSLIREINPPQVNASAMGFTNTLNMVGGAVLQPFVGWMLDHLWQGNMQHGVRIYALSSYDLALSILPVLIIIALVILPFVKETHARELTSYVK